MFFSEVLRYVTCIVHQTPSCCSLFYIQEGTHVQQADPFIESGTQIHTVYFIYFQQKHRSKLGPNNHAVLTLAKSNICIMLLQAITVKRVLYIWLSQLSTGQHTTLDKQRIVANFTYRTLSPGILRLKPKLWRSNKVGTYINAHFCVQMGHTWVTQLRVTPTVLFSNAPPLVPTLSYSVSLFLMEPDKQCILAPKQQKTTSGHDLFRLVKGLEDATGRPVTSVQFERTRKADWINYSSTEKFACTLQPSPPPPPNPSPPSSTQYHQVSVHVSMLDAFI